MTAEELQEMEDRFPPVEMNFAEALDQVRAGREVSRALFQHERRVYGLWNCDDMQVRLGCINADDWIITG